MKLREKRRKFGVLFRNSKLIIIFFEWRKIKPVFSSPILAKYHKSFYTCNLQRNDRHFHPSLIFAGGARSLPIVWYPIRCYCIRTLITIVKKFYMLITIVKKFYMLITIVKKVLHVDYNSKKFYSPGIRSELQCYKSFSDCNLGYLW
jgi:hypothetical protein